MENKKPMFAALDAYEDEEAAIKFCWSCLSPRRGSGFVGDVCEICADPTSITEDRTPEELAALRHETYKKALGSLLRNHRAEFFAHVANEQRTAGITDEIVRF